VVAVRDYLKSPGFEFSLPILLALDSIDAKLALDNGIYDLTPEYFEYENTTSDDTERTATGLPPRIYFLWYLPLQFRLWQPSPTLETRVDEQADICVS
jgi:hypothetical protein